MIRDFRFALRALAKAPRFTAATVLVLALGIGANTAIFSVVQAVLLRPLPYRDPDRLVVVLESNARHGGVIPVAPANFYDWQKQNTVFDSVAAAEAWGGTFTGAGRPEQVAGLHVTTNLFAVLGVAPLVGRTLSMEDGLPGNRRALVLSYRLWQRRFGGDPGVIGKTIQLTGEGYTVLGVMPPGFRFAPFWQTKAEFWAPLDYTPSREHDRNGNSLRVFARLKPGVTLEQARTEMRGIARRLALEYPATNADSTARVTPLDEMTAGNVRPALLILAGAVAFILLIACANVANLLLARATARRREIAVRLALGASRLRLVRQLLAESVLLAVAGGAIGLLLAGWSMHALIAATPDIDRFGLPRQQEIGIDGAVLAFTCLLSLATGVAFGLAPALQASRTDLNESLKESGRAFAGGTRGGLRNALVVSEIALALMLLTGAGLLIRSFQRLHSIDPGFHARNVVTMAVGVAGTSHAAADRRPVFYHRLVEQIETVPGVQSASAINHVPLAGDLWSRDFTIEGHEAPRPGREPNAVYRVVLPDYFRTMGIALLDGRDFIESDTQDAPGVIVINQALARRFWPHDDPLGKRMKLGGADSGSPWLTVVGVVRDVKQWEWADKPGSEMYLPYYQTPAPQAYTTLVVRTAGDPAALTNALRAAIWSLDKDLPISGLASMDEIVSNSQWQPRFSMLLLGSFAAVALLLASVGIYSVMSYAVSRRTHEIGIRMTLGARPRDVLGMVLRQGARLAAIGLALGLAGSLALSRVLASLLYRVSPTDPWTFAAISLLLAGVSLAASYLPARRATRVDPLVALRYE